METLNMLDSNLQQRAWSCN